LAYIVVEQGAKLVEELFGDDPLRFTTITTTRRNWNIREGRVIDGLHLPVEFSEWINHDLIDDWSNRFSILGGIIEENARNGIGKFT
jgi:hypothetical protein